MPQIIYRIWQAIGKLGIFIYDLLVYDFIFSKRVTELSFQIKFSLTYHFLLSYSFMDSITANTSISILVMHFSILALYNHFFGDNDLTNDLAKVALAFNPKI